MFSCIQGVLAFIRYDIISKHSMLVSPEETIRAIPAAAKCYQGVAMATQYDIHYITVTASIQLELQHRIIYMY